MKRRMKEARLLTMATLIVALLMQECGPVAPPPPTGSIDGLVSIESEGVDGISVTLSNGASTTTANGGKYLFGVVEAGAYTVAISNYPADAMFNRTWTGVTFATEGEIVTVNFPGTWIRTSSIIGSVTVENEGLGGVTVKISGMGDSETLTDDSGLYGFGGLRAGTYTVEISGFDEDDVVFSSVEATATVAAGDSEVVLFEGTYLRTSAITGQVSVEGTGLDDVTVSLQGRGEERTATTNSAGQYTFSELRSGDYSVGITGYDDDLYGFDVTTATVNVALQETATVPFTGILLRTASIEGTVTVEGQGIRGVTVTVTGGPKDEEHVRTTNDAGYYMVDELHAGDYAVAISDFAGDMHFDATTQSVSVGLRKTATVNFLGTWIRTAGIEGTVTVEGTGLDGITVTLAGDAAAGMETRIPKT